MSEKKTTPYVCHVFVCTNDRQGERESCGDHNALSLRAQIKQQVVERGLRPKVRVSSAGCLGLCARGPNVMLYPQGIWFARVQPQDVGGIVDAVEELAGG